jgi:endonuclease-3
MIAGRLSAQCTDARVNIVTKELFGKYRTIEDFANADLEDVERIVKPCGLYKTKAKSIVEMCRKIMSDFGGEIPQTIEELTSLSGIGRKTANLILGDVYGKPAVVADTHCIRICGRLGFTSSKDPLKTEKELKELLAPEKSSDFCHRLVLFGRETCKARGQNCDSCELSEICPKLIDLPKVAKVPKGGK